jgi:hypothetical protein
MLICAILFIKRQHAMKRLYKPKSTLLNDIGQTVENKIKNVLEPIIQDYLYMGYDEFQLHNMLSDVIDDSLNLIVNNLELEYKSDINRISTFATLVKIDDRSFEKNGNVIGQQGDDLLIDIEVGFKPKYPYIVINDKYWLVCYYNRELCNEIPPR